MEHQILRAIANTLRKKEATLFNSVENPMYM